MSLPSKVEELKIDPSQRRAQVEQYYGETVKTTADLKTTSCCPLVSVPVAHRKISGQIHPEIINRSYGCGSPVPDTLQGSTVLDLGCGTGRDVYLASALVGTEGKVIGLDMTDQQLEVARRHQKYHADALLGKGAESNVEFRKAIIEDLRGAGIEDSSVDVVISNCVLNLSANKKTVFAEIWRVLREGGELYFADIYADRRLPAEAAKDPVLVGECLGGALYVEDFRRMMSETGFHDLRVVSSAPVRETEGPLMKLIPEVNFYSITYRAFKLPGLEDRAEDYGQFAVYSGGKDVLLFDNQFSFSPGVSVRVDGNTAAILQSSRYKNMFAVTARGAHRGVARPETHGGMISMLSATTKSSTKGNSTARDNSACCASVPGNDAEEQKSSGCCVPSKGSGECCEAGSANGGACC